MKAIVVAVFTLAFARPSFADSSDAPAPSEAYACHSESAGLTLTVWKNGSGELLNALVERESDGFSHYLACWDAAPALSPVIGDCYSVMWVDSYDATLLRNDVGEIVARVTQAIGPIGGARRDIGDLVCTTSVPRAAR